ncbi:hypothetical protein BLA29_000740 [Euroglyphus maynei]|uniref:CutA-like protein n=1 Tax=Euroglyphus maynei TaxID=6958 RepID=A0A1Y3BAU6_EURMA|nr:hypothetical protein BLA29_000740 [Euroglyphus maynei]
MAAEFSILYVTFPNMELGRKIAHELLEKRLASFINLIPSMMTMYQANNKIKQNNETEQIDSEILMMAKIRSALASNILELVDRLHPYDLPEMYTVRVGVSCIDQMNGTLRQYLDGNLAKNI